MEENGADNEIEYPALYLSLSLFLSLSHSSRMRVNDFNEASNRIYSDKLFIFFLYATRINLEKIPGLNILLGRIYNL